MSKPETESPVLAAARKKLLLTGAVVFAACAALAGAVTVLRPTGAGAPAVGVPMIGGPFKLTAQDGRVVTEKDFLGAPTLVFFGYTHCPDVCPTTLTQISAILEALGPDARINALFVTVDPERDTPQVLASYLGSFDRRITGLTGDPAAAAAAQRSWRVYARKVPADSGDYSMDHTALVYVMDRDGRFATSLNIDRKPEEAAAELRRYL